MGPFAQPRDLELSLLLRLFRPNRVCDVRKVTGKHGSKPWRAAWRLAEAPNTKSSHEALESTDL